MFSDEFVKRRRLLRQVFYTILITDELLKKRHLNKREVNYTSLILYKLVFRRVFYYTSVFLYKIIDFHNRIEGIG